MEPARNDRNFGFLSKFNPAGSQRKLAGRPALAWPFTRENSEIIGETREK
jgi:hypothetical protein